MSSWTSHIANLEGDAAIEQVAICGTDTSVWAKSCQLDNISADEINKLKEQNTSYYIGGKKFLKLNECDDMLQLKEAVADCDGKKRNACVGKAGKCMVIGVGKACAQGGDVSKAIFNYREYLKKSGY